jgi:HSP90 family molecular chaperone
MKPLQRNKTLEVAHKNPVKKALDLVTEIPEDNGSFSKLYKPSGKNIRLGIHKDTQNRGKFAEFLHFFSINFTDKQISLESAFIIFIFWLLLVDIQLETITPTVQETIYYLTG